MATEANPNYRPQRSKLLQSIHHLATEAIQITDLRDPSPKEGTLNTSTATEAN
jgi:hypothetical protein